MATELALIYGHMSSARRREFAILLGLMLVGAATELGTIGAVVPFLALLSDDTATRLPPLARVLAEFGRGLPGGSAAAAALVFAAFALLTGAVRIALTWLTQQFGFRLAHEFAVESQRRILLQPYSFHVERHSSTLIAATSRAEVLVFDLALPLMQSLIAGFISIVVVIGLLFIQPLMTITGAVGFALVYLLVSLLTAKPLSRNSATLASAYEQRLKINQESLGGIRDVIIDGAQLQHVEMFRKVDAQLGRARATNNFMAQAPRFMVESLGMVIIAAIALTIAQRHGGIGFALPQLGALALGAQRLLPLVQTVYSGWSLAVGHRSIVGQVIETLDLHLPTTPSTDRGFAAPKLIAVQDVSFRYPSRTDPTLERISFEIPAGSLTALSGPTGSGKSTLADILMGLLRPERGRILIDAVPLTAENVSDWRASLSHVPQAVFLADTTIATNIALGDSRQAPDQDRIAAAARKAQLHDFILSLPSGYDTRVGERGVQLSGGQRQRLGLARAIYKGAPVLILDEPTSALDTATEDAILETLLDLRREGRTIIVIAHRPAIIERSDLVVRLDRGRVLGVETAGARA